jgi:hypothetical protein
MKHQAPQFELPQVEEVFNLVVESAVDGERARQETERARSEAFLAKIQEQEQQLTLI